jgi:hypothetical protein
MTVDAGAVSDHLCVVWSQIPRLKASISASRRLFRRSHLHCFRSVALFFPTPTAVTYWQISYSQQPTLAYNNVYWDCNVNASLHESGAFKGGIYRFIWNGNDKEKRALTYQKLKNGGLGLPSLTARLRSARAHWVAKLTGEQRPWMKLVVEDGVDHGKLKYWKRRLFRPTCIGFLHRANRLHLGKNRQI